MLKKILIGLIALVGLGLLTFFFIGPYFFLKFSLEPQLKKMQADDKVYFERLKADQKDLAGSPFVHKAGGRFDAGPLLNALVVWDEDKILPTMKLAVPADIFSQMKSWDKGAWIEHAQDVDWTRLDFRWMGELSRFDYWEIRGGCPNCASSDPKSYHPEYLESPNYRHMLFWARLRVLKSLIDKDIAHAVRDVQNLARLLMSHETLAASLVALRLYKIEIDLKDYLGKTGVQLSAAWQPPSQDLWRKAERVCKASGLLFSSLRSAELLKKVYAVYSPYLCHCAGMFEGMNTGIFFGKMLGSDVDKKKDLFMRDMVQQAKQCRLKVTREKWLFGRERYFGFFRKPEHAKQFEDMQSYPKFFPSVFKRAIGMQLSLLFLGDGWAAYKAKK